ncbi:TM2 domain-containing protein [Endozoicomonas acroporae]|uniref:TM2 domain-containing protein n=1 Tax=Endozoicomonas acroporae TaxID=1701104 RepID=UPI0013D0D671|nr:TM2 domain-containing protein [Endozoicomonas acroporae]
MINDFIISSWPNGIVYFWLSGQLLCKAQRREHSRSYVTVVVTPQSDCPLSQKIRFHLVNSVTGTIWLFTLGLFGIGWLIDLFLIPAMDREADFRFHSGQYDYSVTWILLAFLGVFGVHRMYLGKWISGILYLFTFGFFGLGVIYDFWTLNDQISIKNSENSYGS